MTPGGVPSDIRYNPVTAQWVICAPARRLRPHEVEPSQLGEGRDEPVASPSQACPFCPGHEAMLPGILLEYRYPRQAGLAAQKRGAPGGVTDAGWLTRVVPNKFPIVAALGEAVALGRTDPAACGPYLVMPGYGRHEVIIENPQHDRDLAGMSPDEARAVVETYHARYLQVTDADPTATVVIFRNHGHRSGTSLAHPHSQLVALPVVPASRRQREDRAQQYLAEHGHCVTCDVATFETEDGRRVIGQSGAFVAFVPFAAEVPFEIWIVPRRHQASFGEISDTEKSELASLLQGVLAALRRRLADPAYNFILHTAPQRSAGARHLHWYLQIRPRFTTPAGFELGTGMSVNPSIPEDDAAWLRES